jgi:hypothetical protein
MPSDPVQAAIEAMARAGAEEEWRQLEIVGATWDDAHKWLKQQWRSTMRAAFFAQHGIVRGVSIEATEEMVDAARSYGAGGFSLTDRYHGMLDAANAAGDLTRPKVQSDDSVRHDRLRQAIAEKDAARGRPLTDRERLANLAQALAEPCETLCSDCPPIGYPTDETRCAPCPRRAEPENEDPKG